MPMDAPLFKVDSVLFQSGSIINPTCFTLTITRSVMVFLSFSIFFT